MSEQTILQTLAAAEKAGLLPNTIHDWLPALLRYNEAFLASQPKPAPVLLTEEDVWENDKIMAVNADADLSMEYVMRFVGAIESAVLRKNGWGE